MQVFKDSRLRAAAKAGDADAVRTWLGRGANPNAHGWVCVTCSEFLSDRA